MATHFTVNRIRKAQRGLQFKLHATHDAAPATSIKLSEAEVQRAVLVLLDKHPSVAFVNRINTRVVDVVDKKTKTGFRPMRTAPKGHPDISGMLRNGRALYVECKSSIGEPTDEQLEFIQRVNRFGGLAFIARSVDDVLRHLPINAHPHVSVKSG